MAASPCEERLNRQAVPPLLRGPASQTPLATSSAPVEGDLSVTSGLGVPSPTDLNEGSLEAGEEPLDEIRFSSCAIGERT